MRSVRREKSEIDLQQHRTMVRVPDIGQNPRAAQHRPDGLGGHRIVDPPALVVCPGIRAEAPPRIQVRLRMKEPERVDESAVDEAADPLALLGQKPADGRIAHRIP